MAEKDISSIDYLGDRERFADLHNVYYFAGEQVIQPEDIHERNQSNSLRKQLQKKTGKNANNKSIVINRDISREIDTWMTAIVIATELQSEIHYAMPVRVMAGDCANYHSQWRAIQREHARKKDLEGAEFLSGFSMKDKLIPITTTILYFGQETWNGPRCLKDMMDLDAFPPEIIDKIADYPLHIIEVRNFPDYEKFRTDLQWVFGFLQRDQDDTELEKYVAEHREAFADLPEDAYDMISQFSHSAALDENKEFYKTRKGNVNMCKALDDMLSKRETLGELKGMIKTCQEFGVSVEVTTQKIMKECNLTEDTAKEYIQKYWVKQ